MTSESRLLSCESSRSSQITSHLELENHSLSAIEQPDRFGENGCISMPNLVGENDAENINQSRDAKQNEHLTPRSNHEEEVVDPNSVEAEPSSAQTDRQERRNRDNIFELPRFAHSSMIPTLAREETSPSQVIMLHSTESSESADSTESHVCRICQLTEKESESPLEETGCECRGSVRMCHRTCAEQWIRSRHSNQCEICHNELGYDLYYTPHPEAPSPEQADENVDQPRRPSGQKPVICRDTRRGWFAVIITVMLFACATAISMMVHINQDYDTAIFHATIKNESLPDSTSHDFNLSFSLATSILIFCCVMTFGIALLWTMAELVLWPREAELRRQILQWEAAYARGITRTRAIVTIRRRDSLMDNILLQETLV